MTSFLLVIYYNNRDSLSAGIITALINRVGDVFFILVIGAMSSYLSFGCYRGQEAVWVLLRILVLLGRVTKRAQVPFSAWLPEAMAAPTPVSTLVHSSTLVTAGVYVIIRFSELLRRVAVYALLFCSMITVIIAGMGGTIEVDIKKVIALSTLRQVGIIMFSIRVGAVVVAFFHLVVHAFFKALMFMCMGGVIFYSGGYQDARFLGSLWQKMPLASALMILRNISLIGLPFMSGFYSKELIISHFLVDSCSLVGFVMLFFSLVLTMAYGVRILLLIIVSRERHSIRHYKSGNCYYVGALLLIRNGAVRVGLLLQCFLLPLVFLRDMRGSIFYGGLGLRVMWFLNLMLLGCFLDSGFLKKGVSEFVGGIWFLKNLSGNVIRSSSLKVLSKVLSLVEIGIVRRYLWGPGLGGMMVSSRKNSRRWRVRLIGVLRFLCLVLWVAVLV